MQRVVVEADLGIEGDDLAAAGNDQGVDFDDGAVEGDERGIHAVDELAEGGDLLAFQAEAGGEAPGMEAGDARGGIDANAQDFLRVIDADFLDLHAALG